MIKVVILIYLLSAVEYYPREGKDGKRNSNTKQGSETISCHWNIEISNLVHIR
jgi:hypothetical protein